VDDDNSLAPDYISRVVKIFSEHPEVGAVGGQGIGVYESGLPVWMNESLSCSIAIGPQLPAGGYVPWNRGYLYGAGLCFRRSIWIELQSIGWEPFAFGRAGSGTTGSQLLLSGDVIELCLAVQALGYRLYYEPALSFKHHIPSARLQWSYWLRLYEGFGATNCAIAVLRARLRPDRSPVRRGMELLARMVYAQLHRPFRRFWSQRARRRSEGDLLALREVAKAGYAIAATTIFWSALRAKWPACIKSKKRG
jgi:GT2 family glycosyltransferase